MVAGSGNGRRKEGVRNAKVSTADEAAGGRYRRRAAVEEEADAAAAGHGEVGRRRVFVCLLLPGFWTRLWAN